MIGIVDYDFVFAEKGSNLPSLGAMKMATFLQKEQPQLLLSLNQVPLCEKVYFFSEMPLDSFPLEIITAENLVAYGAVFSEEFPRLAHHMMPDTRLYRKYIQQEVAAERMSVSKGLDILDSTYYLAKVNDELLPIPAAPARKKFYLYDKDFLSYSDCWTIFDSIMKKRPSTIYSVEPLLCHTMKQFLFLREEYEKVSRSNKIILDYYVPLHQFDAYFSKYKLKLLGEITKESNVCVYIGKPYGAQAFGEVFYIRNMVYCLNLLFSYYSRNIPIKVEIYEPPLGYQNPFEELYIGIREWANNKNWDITLRASLTRIKRRKEQLNQLLEKHRIFNQFLDESKNSVKNKRGIWTIV